MVIHDGDKVVPIAKLTPKQTKFVDTFVETGNGTQSALAAYDTESVDVAKSIASENLTKPNVVHAIELKKTDLRKKFEEEAVNAMKVMLELMETAKSENVRQLAAKDILDRAGYKPAEKSDINMNVGHATEVAKRARLRVAEQPEEETSTEPTESDTE